ncbi:MAG: lipopolysaccharide transport periplasmic protein LptA [Gammaproteobacteria bacterium]|jgi:lipopolysaccharide export system protein LptA
MRLERLLLLALLLGLALPAYALRSDATKPVEIKADRVRVDGRTGRSIYQGHVRLTQGTLHMEADRVEVYLTPARKLSRIVALGDPATLQQQADNGELVKARAARMEYEANTHRIVLTDGVELQQGRNRFSGARVVYQITDSRLEAGGSDNKPVRAILIPPPPKAKETPAKP